MQVRNEFTKETHDLGHSEVMVAVVKYTDNFVVNGENKVLREESFGGKMQRIVSVELYSCFSYHASEDGKVIVLDEHELSDENALETVFIPEGVAESYINQVHQEFMEMEDKPLMQLLIYREAR